MSKKINREVVKRAGKRKQTEAMIKDPKPTMELLRNRGTKLNPKTGSKMMRGNMLHKAFPTNTK